MVDGPSYRERELDLWRPADSDTWCFLQK